MTYKSLKELFKAICDAIRSKEGSTDIINHQDIPARIRTLVTSASTMLQRNKKVQPLETEQNVYPDEGYDGLSSVTIEAIPATHIGSGVIKKSEDDYVPSTFDQYIPANQYLTGIQTIKGDTDLIPENIKSGVTIFNVEGSYVGTGTTTIPEGYVDTSSGDATASHILNGKKAWVDGVEITGSIPIKTSSNLSVNGDTVTVPSGYYESQASKSVSTVAQASPTITVDSNGLITASVTQGAGYVSSGTKSDTEQLTTQAEKTITPGTSSKTAVNKGVYTTGVVTVAGDSDLIASNIKKGVTIFDVTGSYTGSAPSLQSLQTITPSKSTQTFNVSSGYDGFVSPITVNPIPDKYIDTDSISTIESGSTAYTGYGTTDDPIVESDNIAIYHTFDDDYFFRDGSSIVLKAPLSLFGDATQDEVLSGAKFTSLNGFNIRGTATMTSGGDYSAGDVVQSAASENVQFSFLNSNSAAYLRYCNKSDLTASSGKVQMNNYTNLTATSSSDCTVLKGKCVQAELVSAGSGSYSDIFYIPSNATLSVPTSGTKYVRANTAYRMFVIA